MKDSSSAEDLLDAPTVAPSGDPTGAMPIDRQLRPGTRIDDYEILGEIARGAMGVVYQAKQVSLGRVVALKIMMPDEAGSELTRRFVAEAEAAASLDHPGIVPVFDVGRFGDRLFFTMALIEGPSLARLLLEGPFSPVKSARIARSVADAIAHAHRKRLVHRDIKPANILIDAAGQTRVTDFGVCKNLGQQNEMTAVGEIVGTPHYMPPEQAGGSDGKVGPASDVYSIGAVLYAMLTGRPPFQAANPIDVVSQLLTRPPVSPRRLDPTIPRDLEVIVMKCLSKAKQDRYQTAESLADDLEHFLEGEPISARPPDWFQRLRQAIDQHVLVASVSGTAAGILVLLTAMLLMSSIKTSWQVRELEDQLAQERTTVATVLAAMRSDRKADQEASATQSDQWAAYEMRRLADSVKRLAEQGRTDTALAVAIEAAKQAVEQGCEVPASIEQTLRLAVAKFESLSTSDIEQRETTPTEADASAETHDQSIKTLIGRSRKMLKKPLTDFELTLYGIRAPESDP